MKARVRNEVKSNMKGGQVYATKGELVTIINLRDDIAICEKKNKERFSTKRTNLCEIL